MVGLTFLEEMGHLSLNNTGCFIIVTSRWESVILLLWYIGYITFMNFEPRLKAYFNGKLLPKTGHRGE